MSSADAQNFDQLTQLLRAWSGGDGRAADIVLSLVYQRLRQLAARKLRADGRHVFMQPTELTNELVINLLGGKVDWEDRAHFFKTIAVAMRNILHDHARRQNTAKRGEGIQGVQLGMANEIAMESISDFDALYEALIQLREHDPRKADAIELNYLVGLELQEIADLLGVSLATINRDLRFARAWLKHRLAV